MVTWEYGSLAWSADVFRVGEAREWRYEQKFWVNSVLVARWTLEIRADGEPAAKPKIGEADERRRWEPDSENKDAYADRDKSPFTAIGAAGWEYCSTTVEKSALNSGVRLGDWIATTSDAVRVSHTFKRRRSE